MYKNRILSIIIFGAIIFSCYLLLRGITDISRPFSAQNSNLGKKENSQRQIVYVGVISRYPPELIYNGYQPLLDYLSQNSEYQFDLKLSSTYEETVEQLANNSVSVAFLGSYIYVKAHDKYGINCILKPLNENSSPYSKSAVITRANSNINSIKDLAGKKIALPSEQSFSGKWLKYMALGDYGLTMKDLNQIHYFSHHQTVVYEVLKGNYDAGVVKERIADEYGKQGIKIFQYSDPFPGSPIVVAPGIDIKIVTAIKTALLSISESKDKQKIVQGWDQEFSNGFIEAMDSDYDGVRKIMKALGE